MTTVLCLIYDKRRAKPRVSQPFQKQALSQNLWSHWDFFHGFIDPCIRVLTRTLMALTPAAAGIRRGYTAVRKSELKGCRKIFCWIFYLEIQRVKSHLQNMETGELLTSTQLEFHPWSKYKYTAWVSLIVNSDFGTLRKEAWELSGCVLFATYFLKQHKTLIYLKRKR